MGYLGFVIFGFKRRVKNHGEAYLVRCPHCDNDVFFELLKIRNWFHIFWIPLIPLFASRVLDCPICGTNIEIKRKYRKEAKELVNKCEKYRNGAITEDEYIDHLQEFEQLIRDDDDSDESDDSNRSSA